jgi:glycosyltransferase involved in cell wall biosynthesis
VTPPKELQFAVVIPAYNEAATVRAVVEGALRHAPLVIVVDDGSDDGTAAALQGLPITLLANAANEGKAASLWRGMQQALACGVDAVVTLDGDGQHDPADIVRLVTAARRFPGRIIVGARLAGRRNIPALRYAANRFANFWIAWAAGHRIEDSQSGFRVYPAKLLQQLDIARDRAAGFVFESEVLIEASRLGVPSVAIRVAAIYPRSARRSHFRPVLDACRIGRMILRKLLSRGLYLGGLARSLKGAPPEPQDQRQGGWYKS